MILFGYRKYPKLMSISTEKHSHLPLSCVLFR